MDYLNWSRIRVKRLGVSDSQPGTKLSVQAMTSLCGKMNRWKVAAARKEGGLLCEHGEEKWLRNRIKEGEDQGGLGGHRTGGSRGNYRLRVRLWKPEKISIFLS